MDPLDETVLVRTTLTLLVGGFLLIGPGALGVGSSLPLAVALLVLAGLCYTGRERLAAAFERVGYPGVGATLWVAPGLAALVAGVWLGATPGELQTLGGVLGLVGMANYFLRPVYHLAGDLIRALTDRS